MGSLEYFMEVKIIQFILIIILIILFLLYEIQQLISNIDSWMECMIFLVQLLIVILCFGMGAMWHGGQHRPKSRLA